jgi:hypothetical protein
VQDKNYRGLVSAGGQETDSLPGLTANTSPRHFAAIWGIPHCAQNAKTSEMKKSELVFGWLISLIILKSSFKKEKLLFLFLTTAVPDP